MEKQITVIGKRESVNLATVEEQANGCVVASVEDEHVTHAQFRKALKREYPRHTFYAHHEHGYIIAQADPAHEVVL